MPAKNLLTVRPSHHSIGNFSLLACLVQFRAEFLRPPFCKVSINKKVADTAESFPVKRESTGQVAFI